jgi:acyl carrier protein
MLTMRHRNADGSETLAALVRRALGAACSVDACGLDDRTELADLNLDSLTLVTVLAQIEAVYGVDFSTADTLDAFGAADVGELVGTIARVVARARARGGAAQ